MQNSLTKKLVKNFFWISLLLHILFFMAFFIALKTQPQEQKKHAQEYVPSYLYKGAITPSAQRQTENQQQNSIRTQRTIKSNPSPQSTLNTQQLAKVTKDAVSIAKNTHPEPSLMASSLTMLRNNLMEDITKPRDTAEPILLVGDEHQIADPFIRLIGRALSANFRYPEVEGRLGIKGRVLIEMTLHPEGYFDDVQIVQSSNNEHLDTAALYAVNKAPRIEGADMFLKKPKRFVVGFVFLIN